MVNPIKVLYKKKISLDAIDIARERILIYKKDSFLGKILEITEKELMLDSLSVENISKELNITRGHLYKLVKEKTGRSIKSFIDDFRYTLAVDLLRDKKNTISQVAYIIGFSDVSHFSYSFKKYVGVSPSEYINSQK